VFVICEQVYKPQKTTMSQHKPPQLEAQLSKIEHQGEQRIKVEIPFDKEAIHLLKKIPNRRWSQSKQCWHLPYTKESFEALKSVFKVSFESKNELESVSEFKDEVKRSVSFKESQGHSNDRIRILSENDFRIKAIVPWNRKDWIEQIKKIKGRAWNLEEKYWSLPRNQATVASLKRSFENHLDWDESILHLAFSTKESVKDEISNNYISIKNTSANIAIPDQFFRNINKNGSLVKVYFGDKLILKWLSSEWLIAYVPYDKKGWIGVMNKVPGRKWNAEKGYWEIPYVQESLKMIWSMIGKEHIQKDFEISPSIPKEIPKKQPENNRRRKYQLNEMQRKAMVVFEERLLLEHKSLSKLP
jgi:hypothetical protein